MAENKLSLSGMKDELNKGLDRLAKGLPEKPETKMILTRNLLKLAEMKTKNSYMLDQILTSSNKDTAVLAIVNNTINGLILNEDFYLVSFGGKANSIVEIKTGRAWRKIAMQYSMKPIKQINSIVLSSKDTYKTNGFPARLVDVQVDFNVDKSKFENIRGAYAEVEYQDGSFATRFLSIDEIKQMRDMSPSMSEKGKAYSPWTKFPFKMVESKILRDLIMREIDLDKRKMASDGYRLVEDDMPIKVNQTEDAIDITNDYDLMEETLQEQVLEPSLEASQQTEIIEDDFILYEE